MDMLEINSLQIAATIGVHAWEKQIKQKLLIDLKIASSFEQCNDELKNALDYDKLCSNVTSFVEENDFNLIETVAEKVAQLIKQQFEVSQLTVRVCKPNCIKNAGNICVVIKR